MKSRHTRRIAFLVSWLMIGQFILPLLVWEQPALAASEGGQEPSWSLPLPDAIKDWTLDEESGYIFALSLNTSQLFFIRHQDMTLERVVNLDSNPSDLYVDEGKIYLGYSQDQLIQVLDIANGTIERSIPTGEPVERLVKYGDDVFFTDQFSYDSIRRVHLPTAEISEVAIMENVSVANVDLDINREKGLLYVLGSYYMAVLDLSDLSRIVSYVEVNSYSGKHVIAKGDDVYYGRYRFDAHELTDIRNEYRNSTVGQEQVFYVAGDYVVTNMHIYDKETGLVLKPLPKDAYIPLMDSEQYLYWTFDGQAYKAKIDLEKPSYGGHQPGNKRLYLGAPIVDWLIVDESIYAITEDHTLISINKHALTVEWELPIGSKPTDLAVVGRKLYIANSGSSFLQTVDLTDLTTEAIKVPGLGIKPFALDSHGNRLFVLSKPIADEHYSTLHIYTPETGKWEEVPFDYVTERGLSQIAVSPEDGRLYFLEENVKQLGWMSMDSPSPDEYTYIDLPMAIRINRLFIEYPYAYTGFQTMDLETMNAVTLFPEPLIYAHGSYVFTSHAVYDHKTAEKRFDLPFEAALVAIDDDTGKVYVLKGEAEFPFSKRDLIFQFDSLHHLEVYMEQFVPGEATVVDLNTKAGQVNGFLFFEPAENDQEVLYYDVYEMGYSPHPITWAPQLDVGTHLGQVSKDQQVDGVYYKEIDIFIVMPQQRYYAIFGNVDIGHGEIARTPGYRLVRIWDVPAFLPDDVSYVDLDSNPDTISGVVTFKPVKTEMVNDTYELVFAGDDGLIGAPLLVKNAEPPYELHIPGGTPIPDGATQLVLFYRDHLGGYAPYPVSIPLNDRRTKPNAWNIQIVNSTGTENDTITVSDLEPGAIVRVYSLDNELLHEANVPQNDTKVTFRVDFLSASGGSLKFTLKNPGLLESNPVTITYSRETSGGGSPGGGNTGGGNPGGGGSVPIVVPPPAGGGGTVPVVVPPPGGGSPTTGNPSDGSGHAAGGISAEFEYSDDETSGNGTFVVKLGAIKEYAENNRELNTISISLDQLVFGQDFPSDSSRALTYELPVKHLKDARETIEGKWLEFMSNFGVLRLKVDPLLQEATASTFRVEMGELDARDQQQWEQAIKDANVRVIGSPKRFGTTIAIGSATSDVQLGKSYREHIIVVEDVPDSLDVSRLAGVMVDPDTGQCLPVPSRFKLEDGKLIATLYGKENAIYAIVEKDAIFTDLDGNGEGVQSIEKLAQRLIIDGYEDNTFRPSNAITRAEFAALLVRALGILPKTEWATNFKDVEPGHWFYAFAVEAANADLIHGYEDGSFRPQQTITHTEMFMMLGNALQYIRGNHESDQAHIQEAINRLKLSEPVPDWAEEAVAALADLGILKAGDPVLESLGGQTTREEAAIYLYRLLKAVSFAQ